jgi:ubiquinone/menaquinone biosynthesis C-methylase UbiE
MNLKERSFIMSPGSPPVVEAPLPRPPISNWLSEFEEKAAREFRRRTGLDYKATMAKAIEAAEPRPGMQVLDVATGTGVIARQLVGLLGEKGKIIGVDATEEMVERARLSALSAGVGRRLEWRVAPAESLPFDGRSFDLVTCTLAFHLLQAPRFLKEAYRVLKPGGRLLIATELASPGRLSRLRLKVMHNYYQYLARDRTEATARFYSSAEVVEMLKTAGFRQSVIRGLGRRSRYARVFSLIKAVK